MTDEPSVTEPLLEKAENLAKTSLTLLKLKCLDKTVDTTSILASRVLLVLAFSFFLFMLSAGVAFWLGDLLSRNYYGFLIVAAFYALLGLILFFIHPFIKDRFYNLFIKHLFNFVCEKSQIEQN